MNVASCWRRRGVALLLTLLPCLLQAHGGVVAEDDLCVINIGYLKAHFKIYLPQQRGHAEYCEDIPERGASVFVMEYQHDGLGDAAIDFRIIENVTGKGTFARLEDVQQLEDIDAVTVRYEPPAVVPDVYTLLQEFPTDGEYIGIVSARNTDTDKLYTAVFPFAVGDTGTGVWPWIIGGLLALQFIYWYWGRGQRTSAAMLVAALAGTLLSPTLPAESAASWSSDKGYYVVRYDTSIGAPDLNRIHNWTLHIARADGSAVESATVSFDGGMPEHNHGLPTAPQVVALPVAGDYEVRGVRFHMRGYWEIVLQIDDGERRDRVVIPLEL